MNKLYLPFALLLLLILLIYSIHSTLIVRFDMAIGHWFYQLHDYPAFSVFTWIGTLGSTIGIIVLLFIFMIVLGLVHKTLVVPAILFLSVLFGNIGNKLLKVVIGRERPMFTDHIVDGFSFPSGHVMVGSILYGMIAYFLAKGKNKHKVAISILTISLLICIGVSRLIEGEHFLTDVIGGYIGAGLFLIGFISIDRLIDIKLKSKPVKRNISL